jgi:hypothetical protein
MFLWIEISLLKTEALNVFLHLLQLPTKKLKLSHYTPRRRLGERRYSSYSFSTTALDGGEWSASCPGHVLPQGKGPPVPIVQEAGWAPEPVWTQRLEEKSVHLCRGSNLDRPVVQPVARHYTDWATRLLDYNYHQIYFKRSLLYSNTLSKPEEGAIAIVCLTSCI